MTLTDELSAIVGEAFAGEGLDTGFGRVRASDRPDLAQFQCNGPFAAAKAAGRNPRAVAEVIVQRLAGSPVFESISIAGPGFLNLTLTDRFIAARIGALLNDATVGGWVAPVKERIILDYGGPNVAKPLHVGHLRSAIIGEALKRILRAAGHTVIGDIHLGDWGLQMGQLISELALRRPELPYFAHTAGPFPAAPPISLADLEEMYPAASAACKADPARAELARKATKALQDGRPGYRALWRHFVDLSIAALKADYDDLGVAFDLWKGEADVDAIIPGLIDDLVRKGLVEESEGAKIIRVARDSDSKTVPPIILVNSERAVGYHATDIATIVDRTRHHAPDRMLYVVDNRQALHFEQVFRAAELAGYFAEERLEHLPFGTMNGRDGRPFKTREGGVLRLRDLIQMVEQRAREKLAESGLAKDFSAEEARDVAHKVGVAALKFADLSNPRTTDYIFDLDRFMAFEGKTGPYLLYASVRVRSLLRRAEEAGAGAPGGVSLGVAEERDLALRLLGFGDALRLAVEKRMPHLLCEHAFGLAQSFSKFYAACRIVDEADGAVRASRLSLTLAMGRQLDLALGLLGIAAPEQM